MGLRLGLMLQFKKLQWGTLKIATIESSLSFFTLFRMTGFSNTLLGTN